MDDDTEATASTDTLKSLGAEMKSLEKLSKQLGSAISGAFASGISGGKRFEDVLRGLGQRFIDIGLRAAFKPLGTALAGGIEQLMKGGFGQISSLFSGGGGAGQPLNILPFADGGVVGTPSFFPAGRSIGLMAERGAEAIMPLARGPDGKLGVGASGGRGVSVTVNIAAQDVDSFRRGEAQISAALARAVQRGQRGL